MVIVLSAIVPPIFGLEQVSKTVALSGLIVSVQTGVPPNGFCYHAAFTSDYGGTAGNVAQVENSIQQFTSITGKGIFLYECEAGLNWNESLWMFGFGAPSSYNYKQLIEDGLVQAIMIDISPIIRGQDDDTQTVQQIGDGIWDSYIIKIANQAKAFGYPIYLRFGPEMNINQGNGHPSWAENATSFVLAHNKVFTLFKDQGANNVYFVWNPNCDDIGPNHWTDYYPGDAYVDWVGIDLYQFTPDQDPSVMLQIYDDYGTKKPVAICEWGANWKNQNYSDESRAIFINKFFEAVEERPNIKMIAYFYYIDFTFDSSNLPLTTMAYQDRIANSRYIG
jgi:hypothetical protein